MSEYEPVNLLLGDTVYIKEVKRMADLVSVETRVSVRYRTVLRVLVKTQDITRRLRDQCRYDEQ